MLRRRLDRSGVEAGGEAGGEQNAPRTQGGVGQTQRGGVGQTARPFCAAVVRVFRPRPDDPNRASGEGEDGSDPPFLTAGAVRRWGGCGTRWGTGWGTHPHRRRGGRSRHIYPCRKAPPPARGRDDKPDRAARWLNRLSRAFLLVGGVSAACAWSWPGAFPEGDPVAVLVRYHTPNFYRAVVAWYYVAPGVAALLAGQFVLSTSRIWFARLGVAVGLRSRLPASGRFRPRPTARPSSSARCITRSNSPRARPPSG